MKFVSMDGEIKRVAHTSGVIEMIGKEAVDLPVEVYKGLQECAMAAGCIPADAKNRTAAPGPTGPTEKEVAAFVSAQENLGKSQTALIDEKEAFDKEKADFEKAKAEFEKAKVAAGKDTPVEAAKVAAEPETKTAPAAAKGKIV